MLTLSFLTKSIDSLLHYDQHELLKIKSTVEPLAEYCNGGSNSSHPLYLVNVSAYLLLPGQLTRHQCQGMHGEVEIVVGTLYRPLLPPLFHGITRLVFATLSPGAFGSCWHVVGAGCWALWGVSYSVLLSALSRDFGRREPWHSPAAEPDSFCE